MKDCKKYQHKFKKAWKRYIAHYPTGLDNFEESICNDFWDKAIKLMQKKNKK